MKSYSIIKRIISMLLLAVLCLQPVGVAFAQAADTDIDPVEEVIIDEPVEDIPSEDEPDVLSEEVPAQEEVTEQTEEEIPAEEELPQQPVEEQGESEEPAEVPVQTLPVTDAAAGYIADTNRISLEYITDCAVVGYAVRTDAEGNAYIDAQLDVDMMYGEEGTCWINNVKVTAPDIGAVTCDVEKEGDEDSENRFWTKHEDLPVESDGSVAADVLFYSKALPEAGSSTRVDLTFYWKDSNGEIILEEKTYCIVTWTDFEAVKITDPDRISLQNVENEGIKEYAVAVDDEGNAYMDVQVYTDWLTEYQDGLWMEGIRIAMPDTETVDGQLAYEVTKGEYTARGIQYPTVEVEGDTWYLEIFLPLDVNDLPEYDTDTKVNMSFYWKDSRENIIGVEESYCIISKVEQPAVNVTDTGRFDLVDTYYDYENGGVLSGVVQTSKVSSNEDNTVYLDMKVDLDKMSKTDGYYWLEDIRWYPFAQDVYACQVYMTGKKGETVVFQEPAEKNLVVDADDAAFLGFDIPFNESVICTDDEYARIELRVVWLDSEFKWVGEELAYCEVREETEENKYVSVSFDTVGAGEIDSIEYIDIGSAVQLPVMEREGYEFLGWFTGAEGTGDRFTSETRIYEDILLYACWQRSSVAAPYASIESGAVVAQGTKVALMTDSEGASIYYTVDGSEPVGDTAILYAEPIEINTDTVIRAVAAVDTFGISEAAEFSYTVEVKNTGVGDVLPEDMPIGGIIPDCIWATKIVNPVYDGTAKTPAFRLYDGNKLLVEKTDYTVAYKNNKNAAAADENNLKKSPHAVVTLKGNYSGKINICFSIKPVQLNGNDFTVSIPAQAETGKALTPKPVVTWNQTGKAIKLKTDYTMTHGACIAPGSYDVTFTGAGNFSGTLKAQFIVANKADQVLMSKVSVASIKAVNWAEDGAVPELTLSYKSEAKDEATGKNLLYEGIDYTVEYVNNDVVGTASVIITGTGEDADGDGIVYVGSVVKTFKVNGIAMSKVTVNNVLKEGYAYTGAEIRPTELEGSARMTVAYFADAKDPSTGIDLEEGIHYTVEYQKNIAKGTGTVIFTGNPEKGYTGSKKQSFKINAAVLSGDTVDVNIGSCTYTAGGTVPSLSVAWAANDGKLLTEGVDYTVSFKNNKAVYTDESFAAAKPPQAVIKGKGNFAGTITENFIINPRTIDNNSGISVVAADKVATGKPNGYYQSFKVYDVNGKALAAGKEYLKEAVYTLIAIPDSNGALLSTNRVLNKSSVVPAGSVIRITVTGTGNYEGTVSGTYRILDKGYDIKGATIQIMDHKYTGKPIRIVDQRQFVEGKVYMKVGKEIIPLELGKDIRVVENSYVKNTTIGSAKVTFEGLGMFGGTKTVSFKIKARTSDAFGGIFDGSAGGGFGAGGENEVPPITFG